MSSISRRPRRSFQCAQSVLSLIWSFARALPYLTSDQVGHHSSALPMLCDHHSTRKFCSDRPEDLTLQVYRTQPAISRSSHPSPSCPLPREAASSLSHTHPTWKPQSTHTTSETEALPRGHLAFYRKITPPTACRAFRARVDREVTDQERVMLGTAGEEGVYLWDLDDETRKEVVEIPPDPDGEEIGIQVCPAPAEFPAMAEKSQYLEFDDDHIFLCGKSQLHIFSRRTKQRILAFPPIPCPLKSLCATAYYIDLDDDDVTAPLSPARATSGTTPHSSLPDKQPSAVSIIGRAETRGFMGDSLDMKTALMAGTGGLPLMEHAIGTRTSEEQWPLGDYEYNFSASALTRISLSAFCTGQSADDFFSCHYTSTDLICATKLGHLLITRNHAAVLCIPDAKERLRRWGEQTIIIGFGEPIELLAVDRTHVTASTPTHVIFFDTTTLPNLPLDIPNPSTALVEPSSAGISDSAAESWIESTVRSPPITVHSILSLHPYGIRESSCAQMTKTGIYYTYYALGELEAGVGRMVDGLRVPEIPDRAIDRFGICVRGWDLGLDS